MEIIGNTVLLQHDYQIAPGYRVGKPGEEADWITVNIPHDFVITRETRADREGSQGFFDCYHDMTYRKHFNITIEPGQTSYLYFDGIFRNSAVYVNGALVGGRPYGYISFYYDVSGLLEDGDNLLEIYVDNSSPPSDRWYTGAGIYADIRLIRTSSVHVKPMGSFIRTRSVTDAQAEILCDFPVVNKGKTVDAAAVIRLFDGNDFITEQAVSLTLQEGETLLNGRLQIPHPILWSAESPHLYTVRLTIQTDDCVYERYSTNFGIRTIEIDAVQGMRVNRVPVKLKGVNLHHSCGCLGAAFLTDVWEHHLLSLKAMGCNAIRTSHNPMPPEFYELCDRLGFYVFAESVDKWRWENGYYKDIFDEWGLRDVTDMILRDRSHPCIFLWSVGNEVEHQGSDLMLKTLELLTTTVKKLDPTRPVTFAAEPHCNPPSLIDSPLQDKVNRMRKMAAFVDVLSCNYQEAWYAAYHEAMPATPMIGAETYHYFTANGNHFDNLIPLGPWRYVEENPYVLGGFLWAGMEYLGESPRYPSKGWSAAPLDIAGFYKPQAYYQQSLWDDKPMVYAAVYNPQRAFRHENAAWAFPPLQDSLALEKHPNDLFEVFIFSNCESVELVFGGKSYGERLPQEDPSRILRWFLPYGNGDLEVIGKNGGREACRYCLNRAGEPAGLSIHTNKSSLSNKNMHDILILDVELLDSHGRPVRDHDRELRFYMDHSLELAGIDNGDICAHFNYKEPVIRTYRGRCRAFIRGRYSGKGNISVVMTGMPPAEKHICIDVQETC